MDPDALWTELIACLKALHQNPRDRKLRIEVVSLLTQLRNWLNQGGFPPNIGEE